MIDSIGFGARDDDFKNVQEPGRRELQAIEDGREPKRIPGVPSTKAVIDMRAELLPEPAHHVGADTTVTRALGGLVL